MKNFCLVASLLFSLNSFAQIDVSGSQALKLWNRIDLISKTENAQIIFPENNQQAIHLGRISCVFEMYNGCSMIILTPTERKMIVALEGTDDLVNQFAKLGVWVDEENARIGVKSLDCINENNTVLCKIETDEKIIL